jgi:quercetin dioxygenase-like cupin family protein
MKTTIVMAMTVAWGAALGTGSAQAQDWVKAAPANKTVLVDNEHLRLVDVVVPPGGLEPMHTHPEYIEMVLQPAKMRVTYAGKQPEIWNTEAKSYWGLPEPPHSLENVDNHPWHILLLELKDRPYVEAAKTARTERPRARSLAAGHAPAAQSTRARRVASLAGQPRPSSQSAVAVSPSAATL